MSLFINLPDEIMKLIQEHLKATIIQCVFKLNRPLTSFVYGDRILVLKKKIYGTIVKTNNEYSKIRLLPRIIPFWKKCNINFWNNYQFFFEDYNFPYYTPKELKILNSKIIKLNKWNGKINEINASKRLSLNKSHNNIISFKSSSMFQYFF